MYLVMYLCIPPSPYLDLGRMYNLVSRITDGLGELKKLLETHIHNQGLAAIEKCGDAALNVSTDTRFNHVERERERNNLRLWGNHMKSFRCSSVSKKAYRKVKREGPRHSEVILKVLIFPWMIKP